MRDDLPTPEYEVGDRVTVQLNDHNKTPHTGIVREIIWHGERRRYVYFLSENGKKISKRYFADDLHRPGEQAHQ